MNNHKAQELQIKFLTDRRIQTYNNTIVAIYNCAIPKGLLVNKKDNSTKLFYDEKVEYEVERIRILIKDIIREEYSELIKEV